MTVTGLTTNGHDDLHFAVTPSLANTEYSQSVTTGADTSVRTSVFGDLAAFTHFHRTAAGSLEPCIKTSIENDSLAVLEVFDAGAAPPFATVTTDMQPGARIGFVELVHVHPGEVSPCWRTLLEPARGTTEVFGDGSATPQLRLTAPMIDGAIPSIDLVHFHDSDIEPCWKATLTDTAVTSQLFDAEAPRAPVFETAAEMREGGHVGTVTVTHFHDGLLEPCWRSTLTESTVTSQLFDAAAPGVPHVETVAEMLDGGHIGTVAITHFHDGLLDPCWKSSLTDRLVTSQLFDASAPRTPHVETTAEMLDGGHLGTVTLTHFHDGLVEPCWRSSLTDALVTGELFDSDAPATPHLSLRGQMLAGGHIGTVDLVHFHDGSVDPCWATSLEHTKVTTQLFAGARPVIETAADMGDGRIGAVVMNVLDPSADLTINIGGATYRNVDGELVKVG